MAISLKKIYRTAIDGQNEDLTQVADDINDNNEIIQTQVNSNLENITNVQDTVTSLSFLLGNLTEAEVISDNASYTITDSGKLIEVSSAVSAAKTITIPTAVSNGGKAFNFYNASAVTHILLSTAGNFIGTDGSQTTSMDFFPYHFVRVISDGTNWITIEQTPSKPISLTAASSVTLFPNAIQYLTPDQTTTLVLPTLASSNKPVICILYLTQPSSPKTINQPSGISGDWVSWDTNPPPITTASKLYKLVYTCINGVWDGSWAQKGS